MFQEKIIAMRTSGAGLDNDGQIWSESDKQIVEKLFYSGAGITEIALEMKRSEPAVMQQLVKDKFFQNETKSRTRAKREQSCLCPNCAQYESCKREQDQCYEKINEILYGTRKEEDYHA